MNNFPLTLAATFAAISIAMSGSAALATTVSLTAQDVGYYQLPNPNSGGGGGTNNGGPFLFEDGTRNNFFLFDLSGLSGTLTGAKLTIAAQGSYTFNPLSVGTVTYSIYDVSSNTLNLLANRSYGPPASTPGSVSAANDLGSGVSYGSSAVTPSNGVMPTLQIDLLAGLSDIQGSLGGEFALGGSSSLTYFQTGFLWLGGGGAPVQLTLDFAEPSAVPLPAAVWLFGAGAAGLFAARRRSRRTATAA